MSRIELSVPTDSLLKVLEAEPVFLLRLRELATEKIAEEIVRKAAKVEINPAEITKNVIKVATTEMNKVMGDHTKWPPGVAMKIEALVKAHLKDQRVALIDEFRTEMAVAQNERMKAWEEAMQKAVNTHFETIKNELNAMRADIKKEARDAFFEVLLEARSA